MYLNNVEFLSDMGVNLTWSTNDQIQYGKCGRYLEEIVYFELPGIDGHPEVESYYVLNDDEVVEEMVGDIEVPPYRSGYAIQFRQTKSLKSIEEIRSNIWEQEKVCVSRNHPARYYKIEQAVEQIIANMSDVIAFGDRRTDVFRELFRISRFKDDYWNVTNEFGRWVSKNEFQKKAQEVRLKQEAGLDGYEITTRWFLIKDIDKHKEWIECPLAIHVKPIGEKEDSYDYCNRGMNQMRVNDFFDYISKFGKFSVLSNNYSVWPEEGLKKRKELRSLMEKHGVDMEFIPDARMLTETDELPVDKLDLLLEELNRSRDILESNEISAIIAYNTADKNIDPLLLSYFVTDESGKGYQVYVNDKVPAIIVYYDGEHVFDIPKGLPAEVVLYEGGYRFLFSEIFRKNDSIIGKLLCYENELELPPVKVKSGTKSFFSTIHGDEGVHRIEHTTIPVLKKYEYFQTLFEKYAAVAKKFNITIKFS